MYQLEITNLNKEYLAGKTAIKAVDNVSLKVNKGEFISIVGHSGSGKTTLISLIGCILKPSSGEVLFDGKNLCNMSDNDLSGYRSEKVGFMFQFASLMPILTSKENIMLPTVFNANPEPKAIQKVSEYLDMVGLPDKIDSYPSELSGGQQRRIAIARGLINEPEIILADEPTGDLDEETEAEIMQIFKKLNRERNVTIIMVTHNLQLAKQAKRQLIMHHGKLSQIKGKAIAKSLKTKKPKTSSKAKTATTKPKASVKAKAKPAAKAKAKKK